MQPAESFGDVAVPADGLAAGENFRKLFGANILPLSSSEIRAQQSGSVVPLMETADCFMAEHAAFPFIPFGDDVPDQAILRVVFNLLQAVLATALTLGPTRTLFQSQRRFVEENAQASLSRGDIDSFRLVGFRACNQPLSTKAEVRPNSGSGPQHEQSDSQNQNGDCDAEDCEGHRKTSRPAAGLG